MKLEISKTKPSRPPRMVIYGTHKIGKSTFTAGMPNPVFVRSEDGLDNLSVDALPLCETFTDVLECFNYLLSNDTGHKSVVHDSLDWTERLIHEHVCFQKGWQQIGDGPFGAGYKLALNCWKELIDVLTDLNVKKKMYVALIAHSKIIKFEDPMLENFDRYDLDLQEKAGRMMCEFVDIIGFCSEKVAVIENKEGFTKSVKAKGTGQRILNLNKRPAFEAGNRYGLPDSIPLEWSALMTELKKVIKVPPKVEAQAPKQPEPLPSKTEAEKGTAPATKGKTTSADVFNVENPAAKHVGNLVSIAAERKAEKDAQQKDSKLPPIENDELAFGGKVEQ